MAAFATCSKLKKVGRTGTGMKYSPTAVPGQFVFTAGAFTSRCHVILSTQSPFVEFRAAPSAELRRDACFFKNQQRFLRIGLEGTGGSVKRPVVGR